ncbi:MAG: TolC family protein [Bacteroidota bacterium]
MKQITLLFSLLIFIFQAHAQEALSLSKAIEIGLENNFQVKIAETQIEIATNNNDWGVAGKYPTVDLSLSNDNTYSNTNNPVSFIPEINSVSTGFVPAVNANWVLFDGYRVRFTKQQLETLETQSKIDAKIAVEGVIRDIMLAYYAAVLQQEQLLVIEEVLELSRDRINYQEVRKEFGQAGTFDVLQTQDAFLNDSTSYLLQQTNVQNAMRNLQLAMGVDEVGQSYGLTDELNIPTESYELNNLRSKLLSNNFNIQRLAINRELANINTKLQESTRSPTVSLGSGASYNWRLSGGSGTTNNGETLSFDAITAQTLSFNIGFTVSYRLFDGGVRKRNIQNAKLSEMNAQYNIDELKRSAIAQLETTLNTFNNQKSVIAVTDDLLQNARENLVIAEERFRGGLITSFDYRTIQLNFINASQSRLNAIFNLKNTETELVRLIGGLVR